jgi:hypothetical protein
MPLMYGISVVVDIWRLISTSEGDRPEETYVVESIHGNCNQNATKGKLVADAR